VASHVSRRAFLLGAGGIMFPLPFLRSLRADAASEPPHPLVVFRIANGVVQANGVEPERFWPADLGPLTRRALEAQPDRVLGELAPYAERLTLVQGTRFPFAAPAELHAGGGNQLLTASKPEPTSSSSYSLATGESIDNWVARRSPINGGEPLTLFAGRRQGYGDEVLSYRGPRELRAAEDDPWHVYQRLLGGGGVPSFRTSVNDRVLDQLNHLLASPRLSAADRHKLELHADSMRDAELLCAQLSQEQEQRMLDVAGATHLDTTRLDVAELHCDLIALVLSCDQARAVTLQIGDRADTTRYEIDGLSYPNYHTLSHRTSEGTLGEAFDLHTDINRRMLQLYRHLLDRLEEHGVLDDSVTAFVSDVATGSHRYDNIPWVIAGRGDGSLKTGHHLDAGDVTHNKLLNTLLTAIGHRTAEDGPITDFGDGELEPGLIDGMLA